MPYFQRQPIEGLVDAGLSSAQIAGLPSRILTAPALAGSNTRPFCPVATATGIVDQATAVLASERPSGSPASSAWLDPGSTTSASTQSKQSSQLQAQLGQLIEQFVALASQPPSPAAGAPLLEAVPEQTPSLDASCVVVEPAPVLEPSGPVAPGGTAQISVSLVNEGEQPAQIAFFSTGLIGEDGACIAAERISIQPCELLLSPGKTGEVIVRVAIPAQTRCGVYSGLIRASKLDYLHAVLVIPVESP